MSEFVKALLVRSATVHESCFDEMIRLQEYKDELKKSLMNSLKEALEDDNEYVKEYVVYID